MKTTGESTTRLTATELWKYFQNHMFELGTSEHMIASDPEWNTEIYITQYGDTEFAEIKVYIDDKVVHSELCYDEDSCAFSYKEIVGDYLSPLIPPLDDYAIPDEVKDDDYEDEDESALEDLAYQAQDTVLMGFCDFLQICVGDENYDVGEHFDGDTIGMMLQTVLETLGMDYALPIYYPTVVTGDDGSITIEEYPYGS